MPLHIIFLPTSPTTPSLLSPYITPSSILAADFTSWSYPVQTYQPLHHNVLALLAMQDAEGIDQRDRHAQLTDYWTREWLTRTLGRNLGGREDVDVGAAVGVGRESFGQGTRGRKTVRKGWSGTSEALSVLGSWFGVALGRRLASRTEWDRGVGGCRDGDVLPPYTKGEDPPAYER